MSDWIPVDVLLPEHEEKSYWVCTDTKYQCEAYWRDNSISWGWYGIPMYSKVVAWQQLPEPYVEKVECCPFCGETEEGIAIKTGKDEYGTVWHWAECESCGARGPSCIDRERVIKEWNARQKTKNEKVENEG